MEFLKKLLCGALSASMLTASAAIPAAAEDDIKVLLDGAAISFDVPPQIINDRTMVPLRAIFEALGASVEWDQETQTVTSSKDDVTIQLTINSSTMYVNDNAVTLDSPACIVDGRTLVPVRAISEAYNTSVDWNGDTRTVTITADTAAPQAYEDVSANVAQINDFINNGMYVEAMQECENTKAWHNLSPEDINIIDGLYETAKSKYNDYLNSANSNTSSSNSRLTADQLEVKVRPDGTTLMVRNMSDSPITFSTVVISSDIYNSFTINNQLFKEVTINPGEYKQIWCHYMLSRKSDLGLASYGYVVIEWRGEQYYVAFDCNGITDFYKGNARGPAE